MLQNISYKNNLTNEEVGRKMQSVIGEYDHILTKLKRKLRRIDNNSGLAMTILQSTVKVKRRRVRQMRDGKIKEWTGIDFASSTRAEENRTRLKGIFGKSSVVPQRPLKVTG